MLLLLSLRIEMLVHGSVILYNFIILFLCVLARSISNQVCLYSEILLNSSVKKKFNTGRWNIESVFYYGIVLRKTVNTLSRET